MSIQNNLKTGLFDDSSDSSRVGGDVGSENMEKKDPPPDSELTEFDSSPKLKLKLSLFSALLLGLPNSEKFNRDSFSLEAN